MEAYIPFVFLVIIMLSVFAFFYWLGEKNRKIDDEKMRSLLQQMRLERAADSRESKRILKEIQKTNRDNAIFLRMIFERVDDRNEGQSAPG